VSTIAHAQTPKSGQIVGAVLWDNVGTHLVTDDVVVTSGATLTIQQSAIVEFTTTPNTANNLGAVASKTELIIQAGGTLIVEGALGNEVTLTSDAVTKAAGDWQGIVVEDGGDLIMRYTTLEYAVTGVRYEHTTATARTVTIEDSTLSNVSDNAVYVNSATGAQTTLSLLRNTISNATNRGIYINSTTAATLVSGVIADNTISVTGLNSLYLNTSSAQHVITVSGNTLSAIGSGNSTSTNSAGVYIRSVSATSQYTLVGNEIYGAASQGLNINGTWNTVDLVLRDNIIRNNNDTGVYLYRYLSTFNTEFTNNTIRNNGSTTSGGYGIHAFEAYLQDPGLALNIVHC